MQRMNLTRIIHPAFSLASRFTLFQQDVAWRLRMCKVRTN